MKKQIVIALHPTEELRLIKYQKELVRRLFTPGVLIYAHQPLWIPVDFESLQEAKESIMGVTLTGVEYDEKNKMVVCVGEGVKFPLIHIKGDTPNVQAALQDAPLFPLPLKIFRLGECTSPSPNVYELSNVVWKKLT